MTEAQLFRLLAGFFGRDQVMFRMSVLSICGGELPGKVDLGTTRKDFDLKSWARSSTCLFTIIDPECNPRMVVEFFAGFERSVDATEVEHERYLKPILQAAKIPYVTISGEEFEELLDPNSSLDFCTFLEHKFYETVEA